MGGLSTPQHNKKKKIFFFVGLLEQRRGWGGDVEKGELRWERVRPNRGAGQGRKVKMLIKGDSNPKSRRRDSNPAIITGDSNPTWTSDQIIGPCRGTSAEGNTEGRGACTSMEVVGR